MARRVKFTDREKPWAKRRKKRPSREFRTRPQRERVLIVCEGTRTEPNYFEALKQELPQHVAEVIDIQGIGANTQSLVDEAKKRRNQKVNTDYPYDEVWVVFDCDSFGAAQFDNAIHSADAAGLKTAWSNEAFELWYILHFEARQTGMSRSKYRACLATHLGRTYEKNDADMYSKLAKKGDEQEAISRARALQQVHQGTPPHQANPCTTVSELVDKLNSLRT